ncbi:MAG: hypothetical protein U9Q37_03805 [Euryarchaeota archaeon]|nr:hypothetical protein [Euryarchaeota archaeon]
MTEKSEIDIEVLDESYNRGSDYLMRYACAPGVFAAVMDTLGYEDDPAVNDVWKAAIGFVGGTGNMAVGMCLAEVEKPRDYTRLTQKSCGNPCNLVVG